MSNVTYGKVAELFSVVMAELGEEVDMSKVTLIPLSPLEFNVFGDILHKLVERKEKGVGMREMDNIAWKYGAQRTLSTRIVASLYQDGVVEQSGSSPLTYRLRLSKQ